MNKKVSALNEGLLNWQIFLFGEESQILELKKRWNK